MYKYEFSEENKEYLLNFLKVAEETKSSKYCNLKEHEIFPKFLPMDINLQTVIDTKCNDVIDITDSDEEIIITSNIELSQKSMFENDDIQIVNQSSVNDTLHIIKECLQMEKYVCATILNQMTECNLNIIFNLLYEELNFEEILNFGISLKTQNISNEFVVSYYIRHLLLKQLVSDYSDQLQELLNDLAVKFSECMLEELTQIMLNKETSKVLLQFIDGLSVDVKQKLLRKLIFTCEKFQENYIPIVETLIVSQSEYEVLSKLLEVLSSNCDNFSTDKSFGKLLMNMIKLLGKNVILLEQPLKHIIGSHRSIWKSKLQNKLEECLQESSLLSQSIRY